MARARLTARGAGLLLAGLSLVSVGILIQQRELVWAGTFLAALPVLTGIGVSLGLRARTVTRRLDSDRVAAGDPVVGELRLSQPKAGMGTFQLIEEQLPPSVGRPPTFVHPSGWGAIHVGFSYRVHPQVRGRYQLGPLHWRTSDALGLVTATTTHPATSLLTVTPQVFALDQARNSSGAGLSGDTVALRTGASGPDDALIRDYRPRDEVRRIHWPSTARTGTLMVRREERAWDPSAVLILDNRSAAHSRGTPSPSFEWAVSAIASIGLHLLEAGFTIDLVDADGEALAAPQHQDLRAKALINHLTDQRLGDADQLTRALSAARHHSRAQLLIAILGRLSEVDVGLLELARHDRRLGWALLAGPAMDGSSARLRAAGWQVVEGGPGVSVRTAWQSLDLGGIR